MSGGGGLEWWDADKLCKAEPETDVATTAATSEDDASEARPDQLSRESLLLMRVICKDDATEAPPEIVLIRTESCSRGGEEAH